MYEAQEKTTSRLTIRTSPEVSELLAALVKAQKNINHAKKDKTNPHFHSTYVSLSSYLDACKGPLLEEGIVIMQGTGTTEYGIEVSTRLMHTSSQWAETSITIQPGKAGAHAVGSVITYGWRYTLAPLMALGQEDDDGNAAQASASSRPRTAQSTNGGEDKVALLKKFDRAWDKVAESVDGADDPLIAARMREALAFAYSKGSVTNIGQATGDVLRKLTNSISGTERRGKAVEWFMSGAWEISDRAAHTDASGVPFPAQEGGPDAVD